MAKLKNHFFVSIGFWLKIKTVSETGKVPTHEQMILQNCEIFVHLDGKLQFAAKYVTSHQPIYIDIY